MAEILFTTLDRDACHNELETILRDGRYPKAECREADEDGNYSIWSGPQREAGERIEASPAATPEVRPDDAQISRLADLIVAQIQSDGAWLGKLADLIAARMRGG